MKPDLKLGQILEANRLKAGLGRVKLGKQLGLSETSVWRREREEGYARKHMTISDVEAWCDICDTKPPKNPFSLK